MSNVDQIRKAQAKLLTALHWLKAFPPEALRDTGEIDDFHFHVYKMRGHAWCAKSVIPLNAAFALALGEYLTTLETLNPDFVSTCFDHSETSAREGSAASNAWLGG